MPPDNDSKPEVQEAPKEAHADSSVAGVARGSQDKSETQKDWERNQEDRRREGKSASSISLPKVELLLDEFGSVFAKVGDLVESALHWSTPEQDIPTAARKSEVDDRARPGGDAPSGDSSPKPGVIGDAGPAEFEVAKYFQELVSWAAELGHSISLDKAPASTASVAEEKAGDRSDGKSGVKPGERAEAELPTKPEAKPEAKPEPGAEAQSGAKPEVKAGEKLEVKPDSKPEAQPDAKPEALLPPVHVNPDGSSVFTDGKHVTVVVDAHGVTREFKYGPDGKVNEVKEPSGDWKTTDGKNWVNEKGENWQGTVEVSRDGKYDSLTGEGHHIRYPNGSEVKTNKDGLILQTTAVDGSVRAYEYAPGPDGKPMMTTIREFPGKLQAHGGEQEGKDRWDILKGDLWDPLSKAVRHDSGDHSAQKPHVWRTKDGTVWENEKGEPRVGIVQLGKDGSCVLLDKTGATIEQLDGKKVHVANDHSAVVEGGDGRIEKTIDAAHKEREFGYDADGKLNKVKDEKGSTWSTEDGHTWTTPEGRTWNGTITLEKDGTYREVEDGGKNTVKRADGTTTVMETSGRVTDTLPDGTSSEVRPAIDSKKLREIAHELHEEAHLMPSSLEGLGLKTIGLDKAVALDHLKDLSKPEREALNGIYYKEFGTTLREEPDLRELAEHDKNLKAILSNDGNPVGQKADHVMDLLHRQEGSSHRYSTYAKELREELGGMSSAEIQQVDRYSREIYGTSLRDAISKEHDLSVMTRDACEILLKGKDKITAADAAKLDSLEKEEEKKGAKEQKRQADREKVEKLAEALRKESGACEKEGIISDIKKANTHTSRETVFNLLKDTDQVDRELLEEVYKDKYKVSLREEYKFFEDSDRTKFLSLLDRQDGDVIGQHTDSIKIAIDEEHEHFTGRKSAKCEQDIRDSLRIMNSDQLAQMDKYYHYNYDKGLRDAIMQDDKISQSTKDMCEIYLKGTENITPDDWCKLAKIALKEKDTDMFQEVTSSMSPEGRKQFLDDDGEKKVKEAFGAKWYHYAAGFVPGVSLAVNDHEQNKIFQHEKDYARDGHLSVDTMIKDESEGLTVNEQAIDNAFQGMTEQERSDYLRGKELRQKSEEPKSDDDKRALEYYNKIHTALDKVHIVTHDADIARWEDLIAHKGGGVVAKIGAHRGTVYNDSAGDVLKDIESMDKDEWERLHNLKQGKNADGKDPKNPDGSTDADQIKHNKDQYAQYHAELEKALNGLHGARIADADIKTAIDLFDKKMEADKFEDAQGMRRSIVEVIKDDKHWYENDRSAMLKDIANMSPEDQKNYRDDPKFRKQVDDMVESGLGVLGLGESLKSAKQMLEKVKNGEDPNDIVSKLSIRAQERIDHEASAHLKEMPVDLITGGASGVVTSIDGMAGGRGKDALFGSQAADAIRDIQDEFQKHPELREKILHPETAEDRKLSEQFNRAVHMAMNERDYERFVIPLLKTGHLDMDEQTKLNQGLLDNKEQGTFDDMTKATPKEKEKILNDKEYQDKVLGQLSDADRQVALAALKQGKMEPEDEIRYHVNHWGGSDDIMNELRNIKPEEWAQKKRSYLEKYGSDLEYDLLTKLDSGQRSEMIHMFRQYANPLEAYDDARQEMYKTRDGGVGNILTDKVGHANTGNQLDSVANQYSREIAEMNRDLKDFDKLPPEKQKEVEEKLKVSFEHQAEYREQLNDAIKNYRESKSAGAEYTADAIIAAVAIGGAAFTEGQSLWALALICGGASAVTKVGVNSLIMGGDYDVAQQGGKDAVLAFVEGATMAVGPGEVAAMCKIGERAGVLAAEQTLKELGEVGGKKLLEEGSEKLLKDGTTDLMRNAIAHGQKDISEKEFKELAEKVVSKELKGEAREQAIDQIAKTLGKEFRDNLAKESKSWLQQTLLEAKLNAGGGAIGGGAGGLATGLSNWDGSKSLEDNLKMLGESTVSSAASGAALATIMSAGISGLKEGYRLAKGEHAPEVIIGDKPVEVKNAEKAGETTVIGRDQLPGHPESVAPNQVSLSRDAGGRLFVMDNGTSAGGTWIMKEGSQEFVQLKPNQVAELGPHDTVRLGGKDGVELPIKEGERRIGDTVPPTERLPGTGDKSPKTGEKPTETGDQPKSPPDKPGEAQPGDKPSNRTSDKPREQKPSAVSASDFPEKVDERGNKYVEFTTSNGTPVRLREDGGWYYPEALTPEGPAYRGEKIHILVSDPAELAKVEKIILEAAKTDPEMAELMRGLKMQDPRLGDPAFAAQEGKVVGHGQEQKGITVGAQSPEDLGKLQKKLDELLAQHPEIKLDKPIVPEGADRITGESGRVAIARDFYPNGMDATGEPGAKLDKTLADRIQADKSVGFKADGSMDPEFRDPETGKLKDKGLREVEQKSGLKDGSLAYDKDGSLMLKASMDHDPVDADKIGRFAKSQGIGDPAEAGKYSTEQLRQIERKAGMKSGSLSYEGDVLMQTSPPPTDAGNIYLKEQGATNVPRGEIDAKTGKPSDGATDRFAYNKLADKYSVNPITGEIYDQPAGGADVHGDTIPPPLPADSGPPTVRERGDSPAPPPVPADIPSSVKSVLDHADIPLEERPAVIENIRQNELAKPDVMNGYIQDGLALTKKWQDLSELAREVKANEEVVKELRSRLFDDTHDQLATELVDRLVDGGMKEPDALRVAYDPAKLRELAATDAGVRDFFANNPEKLNMVDRLVHADELKSAFNEAVSQRQTQLQELMNCFAEQHHLPKPEVRLVDGQVLGTASGLYHDGVILLNVNDVMSNKEPAKMLDNLYHENIHNQQDSLMIRKLVDDFERERGFPISKPPTADEIAEIQRKYVDPGQLSEKHLAEVLAARNGEVLTGEQSKRAAALLRDWGKEGLGPYAQYWDNIFFSNDQLQKLWQPGGANTLIEQLSHGDTKLCKSLFGTETPPNEVQDLITAFQRSGGHVNEVQAGELLGGLMQKNTEQLLIAQEALYKQYLNNIHELEAGVIGRTIYSEVQNEIAGTLPRASSDLAGSPESGSFDQSPPAPKSPNGSSAAVKRLFGEASVDAVEQSLEALVDELKSEL